MESIKAHLFYVEDDESLGFVTKDNLELQGYKVSHFADGKSAIENLKSDKYNLFILDVMLPEADGFTIAEEIRKYDTETPILFLTAKS
ncbi:MAG: response regulator, partial [Saprospiraceae bacterium]